MGSVSNNTPDNTIHNMASSINETAIEELRNSLYSFESNTYGLHGFIEKNWVANVVGDRGVPLVKCRGVIFVIEHKSKNFSSGIAVDLNGNGVGEFDGIIKMKSIQDRRYIWKLNLEY
jgi:hypothetical protein